MFKNQHEQLLEKEREFISTLRSLNISNSIIESLITQLNVISLSSFSYGIDIGKLIMKNKELLKNENKL